MAEEGLWQNPSGPTGNCRHLPTIVHSEDQLSEKHLELKYVRTGFIGTCASANNKYTEAICHRNYGCVRT